MKKLVIALCALAAASVQAGVKYWDNPAFKAYDADSYVQDGLVLNYDGIRNVGLNEEHSYDTTTWVNLGSGGSAYNLDRYYKTAGSGTSATYAKGDTYGEWADDGFVFNRDAYFGSSGAFTFPATYSMQILVDADKAKQPNTTCAYVTFHNNSWQKSSFAIRTGTANYFYFVADAAFGGTSTRPQFVNSSGLYTYATAIQDAVAGKAMCFSGTTIPTSGSSLKTGTPTEQTVSNLRLGGAQGPQDFTGVIKSYRVYSGKVLSTDELVWNRAVDDYRYFGTSFPPIPVTNAVVTSTFPAVSGDQPAGAYAVDADGYTFTAPATSTVDGRTYACTGYTLETWDDSTGDWGTPVSHSGELSCAATGTSRIRITWQWTPGDGIVTRYTTADYVQDGLVLHYDGIRNLGADQPHSCDTTSWMNLAPGGGWNLSRGVIATEGANPGQWREDGYRFEGESYFAPGVAFPMPTNQTIQVALYGNSFDQTRSGSEGYLYYASGQMTYGGSLSLRYNEPGSQATPNVWVDFSTHGYGTATGNSSARPDATIPYGAPFTYVTAVMADDFGADFFGTTVPTAQTGRWVANASRRDFDKGPPTAKTASNFGIGGIADNSLLKYTGEIKNFRLYNRVLSDEELATNRVIDDYRFHGVMPVTNVIVATSHSFLSGSEKSGNYEISGRYTFTAPSGTQTDARGFAYAFKGYTIEEWNATTQGWSDPVLHEGGNSYEYVVGTAAGKVRLTWIWEASGNLRAAADYGLEDIVPSGLALHFDGIKNVGVESEDVSNPFNAIARAWVNLSPDGPGYLSRQNKTTAAGAWAEDGFAFANESASEGAYFQYAGAFTLAPSYTWQFLLDAKVEAQANSTCGYIMFNDAWKQGSLGIRTKSDYKYGLYYVPDVAFGDGTGDYRPKILDTETAASEYSWATAIVKGNDAMLFAGTEYPTDSVGKKTAPNAATAQTLEKIRIGGGQGDQDFTGKVKSVRYYDRVLSEAELARNRQVDSARYFGVLATTNVVVAAKDGLSFDLSPVAGEYAVEGEYTFTAAAGSDTPTGYKLQTMDAKTGEWETIRAVDSLSYTYDGTDGETVRILWTKTNPFVMIIR